MTKILVIDDEIDLLEEIADMLIFEGYDMFKAEGGEQGLQLAREEKPDLIVCDINMPDIDGHEVLERLRQDSFTSSIPFIFLTARAQPTEIREGMNLGADDYLTKPFEQTALLKAIHTRLARKTTYELQQLRQFSQRLVIFQEAEKQNLAHQLHNSVLNALAGLKINLNIIDQLPVNARANSLQKVQSITDDIVTLVKEISEDLYPGVIQHLNLLESMIWYVKRYETETGIKVHFQYGTLNIEFDEHLKITLFRIVQEALVNIHQHANVNEAWFQLWMEGQQLHLNIQDEGSGFYVEDIIRQPQFTGIIGLRERVSLLDGEITILSSPANGTQIAAHIPLNGSPVMPERNLAPTVPFVSPAKYTTPTLSLLLIDESTLVREGIRTILSEAPVFFVAGEADNAQQGLALAKDGKPDIIILSFSLNDMDGSTLIPELIALENAPGILVLSNYDTRIYAQNALKQGVMGFIGKTASAEQLLAALTSIVRGETYVSPDFLPLDETVDDDTHQMMDSFSTLTGREREIFSLSVKGYTNAQIAESLVISPRTAETHRLNMMRKLGLKGQAALMRFAVDHGLL